ncbi:MAG TPA: DUF4388 domain-containing protein [bacterium]|nr:DUF4388 domain-containing protein [bacterium]
MEALKQKYGMEGDLVELPFPALLEFLHERNVTGRLVLRRGELTKMVFLVEGKPVNVDSTLRDETLGRYLIKKEKISEEQFEQSILMMIEQNIQQGAALVKMGVLSAKELYFEVKSQTREKLLSCFAWTQGTFGFYPDVDFVEDMYRFEMAVPRAMHEGINRFFPKGAVERELARVSPGPIVPAPDIMERIGEYELSEEESEFVLHINGVDDLLTLKKKEKSYPFASRLLYLFLVCDLVGPKGKPEQALRQPAKYQLDLPPIEEFMIPSGHDTSPEVVEEDEGPVEADEGAGPKEGEEAELDVEEDVFCDDEVMDERDFRSASGKSAAEVDEEAIMDDGGPMEEPPLSDEAEAQAGEVPPLARVKMVKGHEKEESDILEFYMGLKSADFFSLLRIGQDADSVQVTEAYRRLRREYDKSNFPPGLSGEALAKLEEIHAQIIRAYETLRTLIGRREYLSRIQAEAEGKTTAAALKAEQYLQQGVQFVRKRDWPRAQAMFEKAVEARPEEPEYLGYLGWTIYSNPEEQAAERTERAKTLIRKAIDINPQMDSSRVFLGKILKEEGKIQEAVEQLETALLCNAKCREAERELKSHEAGEW